MKDFSAAELGSNATAADAVPAPVTDQSVAWETPEGIAVVP